MSSPPNWNHLEYMARWPGYLPFPYDVGRSPGPVPNQQSINWPQAQFAPRMLPAGSASFQPYVFNKPVVDLKPFLRENPRRRRARKNSEGVSIAAVILLIAAGAFFISR